jgi:hypothetical protein
MFLTFINQQWLAFWRGRNRSSSIVTRLVLGFFMLYFLLIAVILGLGMEEFIHRLQPGKSSLLVFNEAILYYFIVDFAVRLQMQDLPIMSVTPYLHLKITRNTLVSFLNFKALLSFLNFIPFIVFLPFIFTKIAAQSGLGASLGFSLAIFALVIFNNYAVLYVKRKSIQHQSVFFVVIGLLAALFTLDYFSIISFSRLSGRVFATISQTPAWSFAFLGLATAMFLINRAFLLKHLYVEELSSREKTRESKEYSFFNRFGAVGELAALELKLILRHKRPRTSLVMALIFLFYGFFFYKEKLLANDQFGMMLFAAVFITGIVIINYGQFLFAWQSGHFDGLMVSKISHTDFIKAKFLLFNISSSIMLVLSSFYALMSYKLLFLHLAAYLFNIGIGSVVVLYFANFNYKRLDISSAAAFNWQGVGATQWIVGFPLLLLPLLVYLPFGIANLPYMGLIVLGGLGFINLICQGFWVRVIVNKFEKQRYTIAEGFRE